MDAGLENFLYFVIYQVFPYVFIVVWLVGSLIRVLTHPYTVKSQSSELLGSKREINWGARLFHIGVIFLFFGHIFGLLIPVSVTNFFGLTPPRAQMLEIVAGGICAILCLVGIGMMIARRIKNPRVRKSSRPSDWLVLVFVAAVLVMGAVSVIQAAVFDLSGKGLGPIVGWATSLLTLQPDAYMYMMEAAVPQKIHIVIGLCIFLIVPFTRLIHIWSGYASPVYFFRNMQKMRMNKVPMGGDVHANIARELDDSIRQDF